MAENTSNEQYIKQAIGFQSNIEHHQQEAAKGNLTSHHAVLPKLEKQLSKCLEFCPSYANKTSKEMIEQYEQEFDKEYQNIHLLDCNKSDVDIVKKIYNE